MWDAGKPNALHSQLLDFDSFEEWYRTEVRGRLVQVLMEVSIQSLDVMMRDSVGSAEYDGTVSARWTLACAQKTNKHTH